MSRYHRHWPLRERFFQLQKVSAVLACSLLLVSCEITGPVAPPQSDTPRPETNAADPVVLSAADTQRASRLYKTKCARCHKLYDPTRYDEAKWRYWMTKMSRKARLKPDQEILLSAFLENLRAKAAQRPSQRK